MERGQENSISEISPKNAALRMYSYVIQSSWEEKKIKMAAGMVERLLKSICLWRLVSNQVPESTKLLLDTVFSDNRVE